MQPINCPVPALSIVTTAAEEPLSLEDVKLYLRIDGEAEDGLIASMITAVRMAAEHYLRKSLVTQVRRVSYNEYMPSVVPLPYGPVQEAGSVVLVARDGTETTVDEQYYRLSSGKAMLITDIVLSAARVEVTYTAGYGDASAVPDAIKQGMLAHIAALFEDRGGDVSIPKAAEALYRPYQYVRL